MGGVDVVRMKKKRMMVFLDGFGSSFFLAGRGFSCAGHRMVDSGSSYIQRLEMKICFLSPKFPEAKTVKRSEVRCEVWWRVEQRTRFCKFPSSPTLTVSRMFTRCFG